MPDTLTCDREASAALLPSRPYQAVAYHYGMLLGVDDFTAEQASHRGKMRLHNAWLHGYGAVWGLGVSIDTDRGEIRVDQGLALDGAGRELHNDVPQCVSVGAWFAAHRQDAGFEYEETGAGVAFDAHVVIRHRACLARPVPAMLDTCAGGSSETAFSRVLETVEILIRPGAPLVPERRGRLMRVLLGLEAPRTAEDGTVLPDDQAAVDGAAEIASAPETDRLAVAAGVHHRVAVLDTLGAQAGQTSEDGEVGLYPDGAPEELVLAVVSGIALTGPGPDAGAPRWTLTGGTVDNDARAVLLSTSTLQDLTAAIPLTAPPPAVPLTAPPPAVPPTVGPRVDASTVARAAAVVTFKVDRPLLALSVAPETFFASVFAAKGWKALAVKGATVAPDGLEVTVTLASDPGASLVRLRALGTGAQPLLGDDHLPLFGETADQPASPGDALRGADFVWHG